MLVIFCGLINKLLDFLYKMGGGNGDWYECEERWGWEVSEGVDGGGEGKRDEKESIGVEVIGLRGCYGY